MFCIVFLLGRWNRYWFYKHSSWWIPWTASFGRIIFFNFKETPWLSWTSSSEASRVKTVKSAIFPIFKKSLSFSSGNRNPAGRFEPALMTSSRDIPKFSNFESVVGRLKTGPWTLFWVITGFFSYDHSW